MIQFSVSESIRLDNGKQDFLDMGHFVSLVFSPDLSTFTFFNDLSEEMKDRIVGGIPDKQYDLQKFDETAKTLVERIIKYETLEESLKS